MPFDDSNLKQMIRDQKDGRIHFPRAKKLPALLKELILGILEADVDKRLSIPEMLSHPWIRNEPHSSSCPNSSCPKTPETSKAKPSSNAGSTNGESHSGNNSNPANANKGSELDAAGTARAGANGAIAHSASPKPTSNRHSGNNSTSVTPEIRKKF